MLKFRSNGAQCVSLLHALQRTLLFCSSSQAEPSHSFVNYLVASLGFSEQRASCLSAELTCLLLQRGRKKVSDFDSIQKADLVITFLKRNGFDQSSIRHIVCSYPLTLRNKIDGNLKPKLEIFQEHGLSNAHLIHFVTKNPGVLCLGLKSSILPALHAIKKLLGNHGNLTALPKRLHRKWMNGFARNLLPNVSLLLSYGIPLESIQKGFFLQPGTYVMKPKSFEDLLIRVEEKWRIPRGSSLFLRSLHLFRGLSSENIESKCQLFKSFGWTDSDFHEMIRKNPSSIEFSERRIKKSLEFLVNELHYKPAEIATRSPLLICSLEKRLIPRYRVLQTLKDKALIKKDYSFYTAVIVSDPVFVKRFVLPFKEVHEVYAQYTGLPLRLLTHGKENTHSQT